ncbi:MAG: PilN domain-containing protein [Beijerinckiaceae bacterium]|nr:PilN domain-containing protein [Beijerinckiaceae bacterium]MCI0736098.1 PilN domain-containing protein [Beijerinckiaceae bacterium]
MNYYRTGVEALSRWIDRVAAVIVDARESFHSRRHFQLVEQNDGSFVLQGKPQREGFDWPSKPFQIVEGRVDPDHSDKLTEILRGTQVEFVLQPGRFMVRLLELPRRASDFLDGIVRAQIDRLTPWSAANAAYGWHPTAEGGTDRMVVTIAATARTLITPFIKAAAGLGVDLIVVSAALQEPLPDATAIKICEQKVAQEAGLRRVRRILVGLLAAAFILSAVSVTASAIIGDAIVARRAELTSRISERRAALQHGHDKASDAVLELQRRKHATPSSVIIIEALSRVLPDHTHLTELRILGDKLQIIGVTRDAPSLIRLIDQTSHFDKATFFAPTTRSAAESGEHFSIEAHIEPVYAPGL